ncbi:MAG: hypothetical protein M3R45_13525 [Pseudomonadota bacterium]|nr:hypothetical protein [Pseudomonadota bacterium]
MTQWKTVLAQGALAGSLASLLSTAVLAIAGRRQAGSAAAPINAVSHWYWGDEALRRQRPDLAHTAAGYLTHHLASTFWATAYAALSRNRPAMRTTQGVLLGAVATSATACFADYQLTPERFTPGFEHRLSSGAMAGVYAAFAVGLAAGALLLRDQYREEDPAEADELQADEAPPVTRRVRAGHV